MIYLKYVPVNIVYISPNDVTKLFRYCIYGFEFAFSCLLNTYNVYVP